MSDVEIVDIPKYASGRYADVINAALAMERGKAVVVPNEGQKSLYGNVSQAIALRGLRDKLATKAINGKVYIIHREDT